MKKEKRKEGEFEHGVYLGCAMISFVFLCLIVFSGVVMIVSGAINVVDEFISLFSFLITVVVGLWGYYQYKVYQYLKNE